MNNTIFKNSAGNFRIWIALILCIALFWADRASKNYAVTHYSTHSQEVTPFLAYATELNKGVALSIFHSENPLVGWVLITCILFIIAYFIWYAINQWRITRHTTRRVPFGCLLAITGAVGNLFDRIMYGGVIDFIVLHYQSYTWPIFNIADILICVGLLIILINKEYV